MNKNIKTRIITRLALLIAMAVILKLFVSITTSEYRFTFYDLPLMISGIMFGPIYGAIAGFSTDVANIVYPNLATGFNLMTISSIMWGLIPGLLLHKRKVNLLTVSITVVMTSAICFSINTWQLAIWSNGASLHWAMLAPRIVTALLKLPIQVIVVEILYSRVIVWDLKKLNKSMGTI